MRKPTLIDDARQWWKFWSIRFSAMGSTLLVAMMAWPQVGLELWGMIPGEVKALLGPRSTLIIPLCFFVASMVARFIKQRGRDGDQ